MNDGKLIKRIGKIGLFFALGLFISSMMSAHEGGQITALFNFFFSFFISIISIALIVYGAELINRNKD